MGDNMIRLQGLELRIGVGTRCCIAVLSPGAARRLAFGLVTAAAERQRTRGREAAELREAQGYLAGERAAKAEIRRDPPNWLVRKARSQSN
jgi:hypothetical protein